LFYCSLLFITGSWQLIALQLLNAAFIGVLAGIGMLYFQDLMPGQAGTATTLFTNTIRVGWVIAGAIAGAVAEIWNYHAVFYAALAMAAGATLCLWKLREV
jgi:SET family sugar efflux transporter-like MFS transporter